MNYLTLKTGLNQQKPNTVHGQRDTCPFCSFESLKNEGEILKESDDLLWLMNKYPTLKDTKQTLIIETERCDDGFHNYSMNKSNNVLSFSIDNWMEFYKNPNFKSAMMFKNAGPFSGASIHHPHMQIVGLENINVTNTLKKDDFGGVLIFEDKTCSLHLSNAPSTEFYEFNIRLKSLDSLDSFSRCIQSVTHYILHKLNAKHKSYNFAFYLIDGDIHLRIFCRFSTSIYLLGYQLKQSPDNISLIAKEIQSTYFQ